MKTRILPVLAVVTLSMSSCASIITGTKDDLTFTSNPPGAKVYVKNVEKCVTPCTVAVQRSLSKSTADFKLDGYKDQSVALEKKFNAVTLGNILIGGVIGVGVDAATGSLTKYAKKSYEVELESN